MASFTATNIQNHLTVALRKDIMHDKGIKFGTQ
jgi:hypothetical protein